MIGDLPAVGHGDELAVLPGHGLAVGALLVAVLALVHQLRRALVLVLRVAALLKEIFISSVKSDTYIATQIVNFNFNKWMITYAVKFTFASIIQLHIYF